MGQRLSRTEKALTTSDLAKVFRVTPDEIGHWARKGRIPAYKKGRQWRFKEREVRKWAKKKSLWPASERVG